MGDYLWITARIVIALAIIVVGTRLGIITNQSERILDLNKEIKSSILLKLFILPFIIFLVCKFLNFGIIFIKVIKNPIIENAKNALLIRFC